MDWTSGPWVWSRKADTDPQGPQGLLSLLWATSKHCGCLGLDSLSGSSSPFLLSPSFDSTTVYWEPAASGEKPKGHRSCSEGNPQMDGLPVVMRCLCVACQFLCGKRHPRVLVVGGGAFGWRPGQSQEGGAPGWDGGPAKRRHQRAASLSRLHAVRTQPRAALRTGN